MIRVLTILAFGRSAGGYGCGGAVLHSGIRPRRCLPPQLQTAAEAPSSVDGIEKLLRDGASTVVYCCGGAPSLRSSIPLRRRSTAVYVRLRSRVFGTVIMKSIVLANGVLCAEPHLGNSGLWANLPPPTWTLCAMLAHRWRVCVRGA